MLSHNSINYFIGFNHRKVVGVVTRLQTNAQSIQPIGLRFYFRKENESKAQYLSNFDCDPIQSKQVSIDDISMSIDCPFDRRLNLL